MRERASFGDGAMIKYTLQCTGGHEFESWFSSSATFDKQAKGGLVECPICADTNVKKALMAPNVYAGATSEEPEQAPSVAQTEHPLAAGDIATKLVKLAAKLKKDATYVGDKFAQEARRMHNEDSQERAIWGEASIEEAKDLVDDGIDFIPLPASPKNQN